jgi:probable addiction module antidote protein
MTAKKNLKDVEALKDVDYATSILSDAIQKLAESGDAQTFLLTLRKLTKAKGGMTALSKRIGINRQNLYRTFASTGNPKFRSLGAILKGLGYKLSISPISAEEAELNDKNVANQNSEAA